MSPVAAAGSMSAGTTSAGVISPTETAPPAPAAPITDVPIATPGPGFDGSTVNEPATFASLVQTAKAALPENVNAPKSA